MKKIWIIVTLCFLLVGCGKQATVENISVKEAQKLWEDTTVLVIDVRSGDEYQNGHIEGAINAPLEQIQNITDVVPDKDKKVILYCQTGVRSESASKKLIDMGYTHVYNMVGGFSAYQETVGV